MNKICLLLFFALISVKLGAQTYNYFGTFNSLGVPNYLATPDTIPEALLDNIDASLPEYYPVPTYHPQYIASGAATNITLTSNADVWVTFVNEGAGYRNVLGFYTYPVGNPPTSVSAINNMKIIFPNVSKLNSGGGLLPGYKVYLGAFNAGTVISWFLIADGFRNGSVTNGNWRLFSNPNFNPEANPSLRYHNVLLYDSTYHKVVMGFEDIRRDYASCDNDFNDALFYVQSNPITAIATNQLINTVNTSPNTSSGNNGGLESNGTLSELIAKRYFQQVSNGKPSETIPHQASKSRSTLVSSIPDLSEKKLSALVTTPNDLLSVTNAKEVYSVDYYDSLQSRTAVIFGTTTQQAVYNHTKAICDRLNGATLENIEYITVSGYTLVTYRLRQESGEREYVSCFSLQESSDSLALYSYWLLSDYPKQGDFYNYQVWSKQPHTLQYAIESILAKAQQYKPINKAMASTHLPQVYMIKGSQVADGLELTIANNSNATQADLSIHYGKTETDSRQSYTQTISLLPNQWNQIKIPLSAVFDADITLNVDKAITDAVYLADGAWGVDAHPTQTQVTQYVVSETAYQNDSNHYFIQRAVNLEATSNETVHVFKMLKSGHRSMDISKFNYLNVNLESNETLTLRLSGAAIQNWSDQARFFLNKQGKITLSIPLSAFHCNGHTNLDLERIQDIIFSTEMHDGNTRDIQLAIHNVFFSKYPSYDLVDTSMQPFSVYPNPISTNGSIQLQWYATMNEDVTITVFTIDGKLLEQTTHAAQSGSNVLSMKLPKLETGTYLVQLTSASGIQTRKITIH